MYKNVSSQKLAVFAWDAAAGAAKTGDSANITAQISKDGAACAASNDTNPTELDSTDAPGVYLFDLTQAETNADLIVFQAASSTSDIEFRPVVIYTDPYLSTDSSGAVALKDDAITSAKYDESTAFPIKSADTGSTQIARTGADGDTLETISDEIAALNDISVANILAGVIEGTVTIQHAIAVILAFAAGTSDGAGGSSIKFKSQDEATNRLTMSVNANGERSVTAIDVTDL